MLPDNSVKVGKIDRRNALHKLFDDILYRRSAHIKAMKDLVRQPFIGQHTSLVRQEKNRHMASLGIKSGKAYRRYIKELRRSV